MLVKFSAEVRTYAVAVMALVLMVLVPVYGRVRRRIDGERLLRAVTVFFALNLVAFAAAAAAGVSIAFGFFVWVSVFGLVVVAQLWAFAADSLNLKSGQRLFPVIMVGANLGALVGAKTAQLAVAVEHRPMAPSLMGGIGLVLRDRYLLMIALLVVLLNWINTTGEFILADFVQRDAAARVAASGGVLDKGTLITAFYGSFNFWVTAAGLAIQLFLVARIYRAVGVRGALLVHPAIVALGYGLIALAPLLGGFVPVFTLIRFVKIAENSIDYSLMNTTRHALFLPVDRDAKYEGKTAIDSFFWRVGDLIQAGVVYAGLHWLGWGVQQFALLSLLLALVWMGLAVDIGRRFAAKARENVINVAPEAAAPIPDLSYQPGRPLEHVVPADAFRDADPGDVLHLAARLADGRPLPPWLRFEPRSRRFIGLPPADMVEEVRVLVVASDVDGFEASSSFTLRAATRGG